MRHSARGMLAIFLFILIGGPAMADQTPDLGVIKATPNHDFKMSDPSMDFSTIAPENFTWFPHNDDANADFKDTDGYKTLTRQWIGYDPTNRDRFQIEIYGGTIDIANVMDGLGYPAFSEKAWFADMKEVDTNGESNTGDILLSKTAADGGTDYVRLVSARNGTSVILIVVRFAGEYFKDYADAIRSLAGSIAFKAPVSPDPAMQGLTTYTVKASSGQSISFGLPQSWKARPDIALDDSASSMRFYSRDYGDGYVGTIAVAVGDLSKFVGNLSAESDSNKEKFLKELADDVVGAAIDNLKLGKKSEVEQIKLDIVEINNNKYDYLFIYSYLLKDIAFSLDIYIHKNDFYINLTVIEQSKDLSQLREALNMTFFDGMIIDK